MMQKSANLYAGEICKSICWKNLQIYMLENFLQTICWEIFERKFFGNYMLENSGGYQRLFDGGNYGTMLWYHTTVSRQ